MRSNRKKGIIGIIVTVFVLILLVILTNISINKFSSIENFFNKIVMPIQNVVSNIKNKTNNKTSVKDVTQLQNQLKDLKIKNEDLEEKLRELEIIKAENKQLREYANMKDEYIEYETIPANIINKDISNLSNTMVINAGKEDGVYENMAVVSKDGLVGNVIAVTKNTAKIQPIIDTSSNISAIISTTRDMVILKGILDAKNKIKITYIPTNSYLAVGDMVETSGMGGIYPKGLLIGTIEKIENTKNQAEKYAVLKTAVDFSKLETVLVITK